MTPEELEAIKDAADCGFGYPLGIESRHVENLIAEVEQLTAAIARQSVEIDHLREMADEANLLAKREELVGESPLGTQVLTLRIEVARLQARLARVVEVTTRAAKCVETAHTWDYEAGTWELAQAILEAAEAPVVPCLAEHNRSTSRGLLSTCPAVRRAAGGSVA